MARITVEDCLAKLDNRFALIHLAAKRVRQLRKGAEPLVYCRNKDVVLSLREIAAGHVFEAEKDHSSVEDKDGLIPEELSEPSEEMASDLEPADQGEEEALEEKS
jgi:DNA-directed RNA polymerase subunit omega